MKQRLYVVQILPYLRDGYEKSTERSYLLSTDLTGFRSLADAQEWAANTVPTFLNPLAFAEDGGEWPLYAQTSDDEPRKSRIITQQEMREFVVSLGLVPPSSETIRNRVWPAADEPWGQWWEDTASQMAEAQKIAIWRFLFPNPYRIVEIELES